MRSRYPRHMDHNPLGNKVITEALINALRGDEFVLYAQPIVGLGQRAGERQFQEILVRFLEEDKEPVAPDSFIPTLRTRGLMNHLDRWVTGRTIRWLRTFSRLIPDKQPPRNSLNIACETLHDQGFGDFVIRKIAENEIPASTLSFEISLPDAAKFEAQVDALVAKLKPRGCSFAFAEFDGTPVSFDLLGRFAADFVKIGVSLVSECDHDAMVCRTLGSLHRRCRELGVRTIAEHVETRETLDILREIGVDYAQGYHTGRPQSLA